MNIRCDGMFSNENIKEVKIGKVSFFPLRFGVGNLAAFEIFAVRFNTFQHKSSTSAALCLAAKVYWKVQRYACLTVDNENNIII